MSLSSGRAAPVTALPVDCGPRELCVDVNGVEAEPGDVGPQRGGEGSSSTCVILYLHNQAIHRR